MWSHLAGRRERVSLHPSGQRQIADLVIVVRVVADASTHLRARHTHAFK